MRAGYVRAGLATAGLAALALSVGGSAPVLAAKSTPPPAPTLTVTKVPVIDDPWYYAGAGDDGPPF